jgi:hypothetical protein
VDQIQFLVQLHQQAVVEVVVMNPVVVNLMVNLVALEEHQVEPQEQLEVVMYQQLVPLKEIQEDKEMVVQQDLAVAAVELELQVEQELKALQV